MQSRSVEFAKKYGVKFEVRSSLNNNPGTIVTEEHEAMEAVVIRGVSIERSQARVTITGIPDEPGMSARILCALGDAAAWPVQSFVKRFRPEFEAHVSEGRCVIGAPA